MRTRIDAVNARVIETIFGQCADFEVLNEHVTLLGQCVHNRLALSGAVVDGDGLLATIGAQVVRTLACGACTALHEGWAPCSRVIAALGLFDFDDLCTQISE